LLQVSRELLRLVEANGVCCLFDSSVAEILVESASTGMTAVEGDDSGKVATSRSLADSIFNPKNKPHHHHSPPLPSSFLRCRTFPGLRTRGVRLQNHHVIPADLVVSNVDLPYTNKYLFSRLHAQSKDHDTRGFSSSVISFLWAFDRPLPSLRHHTTFLAAREEEVEAEGGRKEGGRSGAKEGIDPAKAAWEAVFKDKRFDGRFLNFYVHAPARTDTSVCPPGHDAVMVLVPCPVLGKEGGGQEEEEEEARMIADAREAVLARFESVMGMEDVRDGLIHERVIGPREWREKYSLSRGAVFGLKHDLGQLSVLRPGRKHVGGGEAVS
jgi:phytoene dehydrogenase-like protein